MSSEDSYVRERNSEHPNIGYVGRDPKKLLMALEQVQRLHPLYDKMSVINTIPMARFITMQSGSFGWGGFSE